jgi:hypothetical protein
MDVKGDLEYNYVICDFGFADFASDANRQLVAGLKKPSNTGITIRYAAPEVCFNYTIHSGSISLF